MTCPSCQRSTPPRRDRICAPCRRSHEAKVRVGLILRARFSFGRLANSPWLADPDPRAHFASPNFVLRAMCGDQSGRPA